MLDRILRELFSMRMMAIGLVLFLYAIAHATFVESDYGTPASKIAVYNATWFEILLLYLSLSLIVNIFRYRMFRRSKVAVLSFHLAFLVIIVGAALTRYIGFEGQMRIKEGQTSNVIFSGSPYLILKANDRVNQFTYEDQRWLSEGVENPFSFDFQLPNQPRVEVDYVDFKENMIDTVISADSLDGKALEYVVRGKTHYLFQGNQKAIGRLNLSFEREGAIPGAKIWEESGKLFIQSIQPFQRVDMMKLSREDRMKNGLDPSKVDSVPADTAVPFYAGQLYMFAGESLMFKGMKRNVQQTRVKAEEKGAGINYLTVKLSSKEQERTVTFPGGVDRISEDHYFQFAGLNFALSYGAKPIQTPFHIKCRDFQLDRYPGSDMASSYASEVTLIDSSAQIEHDRRIFMNNVMDYKGYRFFQSSYFPDESGTILSVNYDWWGTNVTYLGYLLMTIGMILSLLSPAGRMSELTRLIRKSRENRKKTLKVSIGILLLLGVNQSNVWAHNDDSTHTHEQESTHQHSHEGHNHDESNENQRKSAFQVENVVIKYPSPSGADQVADLLVQDHDGRIVPFHTLSDKILRKIYRDHRYQDKNAVQVMLAFHLYGPKVWLDKPLLYVSTKIREDLGVGAHISLRQAEDETGNFKWLNDYKEAHEKPDSKKSEYDKKLMKLGERYRVLKQIFSFQYMRIVPVPGDENGTWVRPFDQQLKGKDQTGNELAAQFLRKSYQAAQGNINYDEVKNYLDELKTVQWSDVERLKKIKSNEDLPTRSQVQTEIVYNEFKVFDKVQFIYLLVGALLLILFFSRTLMTPSLQRERYFKIITRAFFAIVVITFVAHGAGLGMRWYISGHAPWSNGYEAVVFIAWSTLLAGFFFVRKNPVVIAATTLLAAMMLFVTELNLLDPDITPLQPVLKSYWLMIHVAIITSSYGFLGISAILGLINLLLYIFKNESNKKRLSMNINEITAIAEVVMTVGLFMLTIGTFLGGIWANESWGRYWGWDPKETWALVSVLTYAVILHLRFIPGLNSRFIFNIVSLWGYSSILFTFFGVNFILVGLHSYAQGEGVATMPTWAWTTIGVFALFTLTAIVKYLIDQTVKKKK